MNPDVFITIAFVGIAVLVALVALVFVVPNARREDARLERRERPRRPRRPLNSRRGRVQRSDKGRTRLLLDCARLDESVLDRSGRPAALCKQPTPFAG